jgi:UDP-N-acetylmuramoylalanine--D-glutamate ligase
MSTSLQDQRVVVYGLARSGLAAARLLVQSGARVSGVDIRAEGELGEGVSALRSLGVSLTLCKEVPSELLSSADLIVLSPGVPLERPEIQQAKERGVPVWAEVELASRFIPSEQLFGITGTNGKSTTTALLGELFAQAGRRAFVGGNIGRALSEAPLSGEEFDAYAVELSSFQLQVVEELRPRGSALLNLTPDHLDRHPSFERYAAAKARIFQNQSEGDFAVVNADDPEAMRAARSARVPLFTFSLQRESPQRQATAVGGEGGFELRLPGQPVERYALTNRALRGRHNLQNAMAAALLARGAQLSPESVQHGLDAFGGLPHRLESVRTLSGVEWINDSKATNVDSSVVALNALQGGIWLIAGGRGKGAPYRPMVDASRGKLKGVLTIGQDAARIEEAFGSDFSIYRCQTLERAVERARTLAENGDRVLLSPACASFDQFQSFEDRGDTFKRLVRAL